MARPNDFTYIERLQGTPKFEEACQLGLKFLELCYDMGIAQPGNLLVGLPCSPKTALAHFNEGYKQGRDEERENVRMTLENMLREKKETDNGSGQRDSMDGGASPLARPGTE